MVDHHLLHTELSALASTAAGELDLHDALHQLGITAAAALGLDGAGVTLRMPDGRTEYITATDAVTLDVERKQDSLREGACVDAIRSSQIVAIGDLDSERPWPKFTDVLLDAGFHAVAGVPLPFQGRNIGALNLYANASRAWTTDHFAAARVLADLAGGYLVTSHLLDEAQTLALQLQHALDSRIIIEQAKGVISGRHGITPDEAFGLIRSHARANRIKVRDLARRIVTDETDPVGGTGSTPAEGGISAP